MRQLCLILVAVSLLATPALATTYYVDVDLGSTCSGSYNPATRACSGGSADAYTNFATMFSSINLAGGDIVYARAGTYTGSGYILSAGSDDDGADGNPVLISNYESETVILDGQDVSGAGGIEAISTDYITIQGFILKNMVYSSSYHVDVRNGTGVIIKDITTIADGASSPQGLYGNSTVSLTVDGLIHTTGASSSQQPDGIYLQSFSGTTTIKNSDITLSMSGGSHIDCIQTYLGSGTLVIEKNACLQESSTNANRQGIYVESSEADVIVRNNVLRNTSTDTAASSNFISIRNKGIGTAGDVYVYNNSIYTKRSNAAIKIGVSYTDPYVKNNIIDIDGTVGYCITFDGTPGTVSRIDYNSADKNNGSPEYMWGGASKNWSTWQATGADANGTSGDPTWTNPPDDMTLAAGSGAIDTGVDLSATFTDDFTGATRTGTWDMGAYESSGGGTAHHNVFKGGSFKGGSMK